MYGNEIKNARLAIGATQMQVAKATGLPQNTISWIELDKGIPNIQQCALLATYYGITIDELIGRNTQTPTVSIDNKHHNVYKVTGNHNKFKKKY